MRISDWSSDVCSSDLLQDRQHDGGAQQELHQRQRHRTAEIEVEAQRLVDRDLQRRRLRPAAERQHHGKGGEAEHEDQARDTRQHRSEEHTSELQSLMRSSYAVFCLKKKTTKSTISTYSHTPR